MGLNNEDSTLLSGPSDGTIRLWDVERKTEIMKTDVGARFSLTQFPDNHEKRDVVYFGVEGPAGFIGYYDFREGGETKKIIESYWVGDIQPYDQNYLFLLENFSSNVKCLDVRMSAIVSQVIVEGHVDSLHC